MNRREIDPVDMLSCRRFLEKLAALIPPTQQKTYEERAQIPKGKITKWRSGQQHIRLEEAWRLARELGVSLDWLADDERQGEEVSREMDEAMKIVRRLGPEVAIARLLQKQTPGPAEAGPVTRHPHPIEPDPENPGPAKKPRSRKSRS